MDLGAILLLIALFLGVGLYLAAPLMGNYSRGTDPENREASALMAERDRVINALQELDFDYKLGKIPEPDYPAERARLLQKGADILRRLDALQPAPIPVKARPDAESRLEAAAAAGAADASAKPARLSDDEIESMLAARRKARKATSAGFCPRCGKPVMVTDQFCPGCGKALR